MSLQKAGCQAVRVSSGRHVFPWMHPVSEVIYPHPPQNGLDSRRMTQARRVPRSLRYKPVICWCSRRKVTAGRTRYSSVFSPSRSPPIGRTAMWSGAGIMKLACRLVETGSWSSKASAPDSRARWLSSSALVPSVPHTATWHQHATATSLHHRCDK